MTIKTLAQVRRLLSPAVQVTVARQQVNIAGVVRGSAVSPALGWE